MRKREINLKNYPIYYNKLIIILICNQINLNLNEAGLYFLKKIKMTRFKKIK